MGEASGALSSSLLPPLFAATRASRRADRVATASTPNTRKRSYTMQWEARERRHTLYGGLLSDVVFAIGQSPHCIEYRVVGPFAAVSSTPSPVWMVRRSPSTFYRPFMGMSTHPRCPSSPAAPPPAPLHPPLASASIMGGGGGPPPRAHHLSAPFHCSGGG